MRLNLHRTQLQARENISDRTGNVSRHYDARLIRSELGLPDLCSGHYDLFKESELERSFKEGKGNEILKGNLVNPVSGLVSCLNRGSALMGCSGPETSSQKIMIEISLILSVYLNSRGIFACQSHHWQI